jgi:RPA family protein
MQSNFNRSKRQPAIRILAQEYSESTLKQQGSGEFDPAFIITKLGAKVNRIVAMGLLELMERRESSSGLFWTGRIRDPSGLHFFSIGNFQPEELQIQADELLARFQQEEPVLIMMIAKSSMRQSEEGSIFTGLRPEEVTIIDSKQYANLLVEACDATMNRIEAFRNSEKLEQTFSEYKKAEIPADLIEGILLSREHYGEIDSEFHKLNVLRSLAIAEGDTAQTQLSENKVESKETESTSSEIDYNAIITEYIERNDAPNGVDFESIVGHCLKNNGERGQSEISIENMVEDGDLFEIKFGWYKLVT